MRMLICFKIYLSMINNRPENRGYESTFTSRLLKILESKNMATLLESGISEIATQLITSLNQELAETIAELNKLQQSIVDQITAFHGQPSNEGRSNHVFKNMCKKRVD
ncbi:unnamed protein product [Orchesella dallaii]|uniref:Uncharacterized protein n=1 Tax=Orchesella dallaii TaxID=48710 RepID=A0ABP1RH58_9HEXA